MLLRFLAFGAVLLPLAHQPTFAADSTALAGSDIPADVAPRVYPAGDQAVLIRTNGDLTVVNKAGKVDATLPASAIQGTVYYKYPQAKYVDSFKTSTPSLLGGVVYFDTLCPIPAYIGLNGVWSCDYFTWDIHTNKVTRQLGLTDDPILTSQGNFKLVSLDSNVSPAPGGSLLFVGRDSKGSRLIRRTETPTGAIYKIEFAPTSASESVGPHVAVASNGDVFFSVYSARSFTDIDARLMRLSSTGEISIAKTIAGAYWQPIVDATRNEVLAVADFQANFYAQSRATKVSDPQETLLETFNASKMVSNGLRFYLSLDGPWNGVTYYPLFNSLWIREEATKSWKQVQQLSDGARATGIKAVLPFADIAYVLLTDGWHPLDPRSLPSPLPTISFKADSEIIDIGQKTILRWTTSDASRVSIDNGIGSVAVSGSREVAPTKTTPYVLTAEGPGGLKTASTTVIVNPPLPAINKGGVVNGKTYAENLTPGMFASAFGINLAEVTMQTPTLSWPTNLSGVQVLVNGVPAPLHYVSANQVNFQVPWETPVGTAKIKVVSNGLQSPEVTVTISTTVPALIADGGYVNIVDPETGAVFVPVQAMQAGKIYLVYATGAGPVSPSVPTGAPGAFSQLQLPFKLEIAGNQLEVKYAGLAPGYIGLYQFNVIAPDLGGDGDPIQTDLKLSVGDQSDSSVVWLENFRRRQ